MVNDIQIMLRSPYQCGVGGGGGSVCFLFFYIEAQRTFLLSANVYNELSQVQRA